MFSAQSRYISILKTFRSVLGSTHPPIQWASEFSSSAVRQPRRKFNHLRLALKLKMNGTIRLLTPYVSIAWTRATLPYTLPVVSYKLILY